jgi:hypothetical protein
LAVLRCHRDRALISSWLSSGARAADLGEDRPPLVEGGPVWWPRTRQAWAAVDHAARVVLQRANKC